MLSRIGIRSRLFKRLCIDIWGDYHRSLPKYYSSEASFVLMLFREKVEYYVRRRKRFFWRVDLPEVQDYVRRRSYSPQGLKRLRLFYHYITHRQIRRLDYVARRKQSNGLGYFLLFMETRASFIVYRLNWVFSVFEVKSFLKLGYLVVNDSIVTYYHHTCTIGDVVSVNELIFNKIYNRIYYRLWTKSIYLYCPGYMRCSLPINIWLIYRFPCYRDVAFPVSVTDFWKKPGGQKRNRRPLGSLVDPMVGRDHLGRLPFK